MMRRLFFISLVLITFSLSAGAQRRSAAKVRSAVSALIGRERSEALRPVMQERLMSEDMAVLSAEGAGFAVVCYDSHVPAVLAYGDQPVDEDNPSPEFLYLMDIYRQQIADGALRPLRSVQLKKVPTLVTTRWAQGSPFNNECPVFPNNYERPCVTGCVATAMAQVLNYHKLPKTMRGWSAYCLPTPSGEMMRLAMDFGKTSIDWANMKDIYNSVSTSAQRAAVAHLMKICGVATNMQYGTGESGAVVWCGVSGINTFFDGVRADHLNTFDLDRVAQELNARRPIIFAGNDSKGGHCFVIDGADGEGRLHCNLGWGGSGDGYYLPTDMAGYSNNQRIAVVYPGDFRPVYKPLEELRGKNVMCIQESVSSIEPNRWYVLWNVGRAGSPYSDGLGSEVMNTHNLPEGERAEYCANQLVRFIPDGKGAYAIQTGLGDYFGTFGYGSGTKTKGSGATKFTIGQIEPLYYWIKDPVKYLDTNGPGGNVVGWGTEAPTRKYSNSSWYIFPVELTDASSDVKVQDIKVSRKKLTLLEEENYSLSSTVLPANASVPQGAWRSNRSTYATVNSEGVVTALKRSSALVSIINESVDGSNVADTCVLRVASSREINLPKNLTNTGLYVIRNTGYSEGYLVAESASATHPTLRGVRNLHDSGLYPGALYENERDLELAGCYWQLLTDAEGKTYLYNYGTQRYLTHSGDQTAYVFTQEPTPINMGVREEDGSWWFNASTEPKSYLCAATHLENPAAFWTIDDAGSIWTVSLVIGSPYTAVDPLIPEGVLRTTDNRQQTTDNGLLYDLQGKRASRSVQGLYISAGEKLLR